MTKMIAPLAVAAAVLMAGTSFAHAFSRSGSTTGPAGRTVSSQGSGSCSGGSCSSGQSVTGPRGNSASRSGNTSCSGGATFTGPAGRTGTRTRSFSR